MQEEKTKLNKFIRNLCKGKSETEIQEAEQHYMDYLIVVKEIADRLELESKDVIDIDLSNEKD